MFKNIFRNINKKSFVNDELVKLEKNTNELLKKLEKSEGDINLDLVKKEMEFILMERDVAFSFENNLKLTNESDGILKKMNKISEILKKNAEENKVVLLDLIKELKDYFFEKELEEMDKEYVLNLFDSIEEKINLKNTNFDSNYIDKFEFNMSGHQYSSFLSCIANIGADNLKGALDDFYKFAENYRMTINEPFWMYERIILKGLLEGIKINFLNYFI